MLISDRFSPVVVLLGLDSDVIRNLSTALHAAGCNIQSDSPSRPSADVVFCSSDPACLRGALAAYPQTPVIVASRLPETATWLDALEAGASDYCAAPFEPSQIRWLLGCTLRPHAAASAAA